MTAIHKNHPLPARESQRPASLLFTVVIPVHNREQLIGATLDSVLAQQETDFEVVVVDDGSTDATLRVLQAYASRVKIVSQHNAGPGAARNRGAAEAAGTYLAFLDSDDFWFPWTMAVIRTVIEQSASVSLVTSHPFEFVNPEELAGIMEEALRFEQFDDFLASSSEFRFAGSGTMVVDRQAFLRAGGFTSRMRAAEDLDLVLRLGAEPGYVFVASPPLIAYRRHGESLVANLDQVLDGIEYLVAQERAGRYPGGRARRAQRQVALARFARSASVAALRGGKLRRGLKLYRRTMAWNLSLGRTKYLAGFPFLAAAALGRGSQAP